jgi:hypothetical protein
MSAGVSDSSFESPSLRIASRRTTVSSSFSARSQHECDRLRAPDARRRTHRQLPHVGILVVAQLDQRRDVVRPDLAEERSGRLAPGRRAPE